MNILNPLTADAKDLQNLLENGAVKSVDLVKIYLNQIQKHDGYLKAMICMAPTKKAINAARRLDQERSAGKLRSALHGIPIVIKVRQFVPPHKRSHALIRTRIILIPILTWA